LYSLRKSFPEDKRVRPANRYILAGAGFILVDVFALFWMHNLESREVSRVNSERISREEFSRRIERAKTFYE